ncbi:UNVERIFIED_CONTAM: hypothetical protein HDU68_003540, partial [Siphonaria sp. JEL0065]
GASYFGVKLVHIPVDARTGEVDLRKVARAINSNPIMIAGSAPNFPHGIIDNIPALATLAIKNGIPMHVDACLGGFIVPFAEKAGFPLPYCVDFRNEGVTSISCDTHKYGFAPKGSSVIMYRTKEIRNFQYFITTEWPGGVYCSPSIAGSRPGALVAGCWAAMMHFGETGYIDSTRQIIGAARAITCGIDSIPELKLIGKPFVSVVAFESSIPSIKIYGVADLLDKKGWHLNVLQNPPAIHIACTFLTVKAASVLVNDLREAVDLLKKDPMAGNGDVAAIYGTMASVPDRTVIKDTLPRLVVSDLDGTLLTPRHTISRRTREALMHAQQHNNGSIQIMIASGRSPRSIQKVIDLFEGHMIPDAVICCNGALNYNPKTKVISCPAFIPVDKATIMIQELTSKISASTSVHEIPPSQRAGYACEVVYIKEILNGEPVYSDDTHFVCDPIWELERKHSIYYEYTTVPDMCEFLNSLQYPDGTFRGGIIKLMALDRTRIAADLYESLPSTLKSEQLTSLSLVYSGPYFLEVSGAGVNKGYGLESYCKANNIARHDVVAFGDLLNDAEMLQFAGLGLCMGNGHEDMKKLADRVIETNAVDGVAREIESWFDLVPSKDALAEPTFLTPSVDE